MDPPPSRRIMVFKIEAAGPEALNVAAIAALHVARYVPREHHAQSLNSEQAFTQMVPPIFPKFVIPAKAGIHVGNMLCVPNESFALAEDDGF